MKKYYVQAASEIKHLESEKDKKIIRDFMVKLFSSDNPRFDEKRFRAASGEE